MCMWSELLYKSKILASYVPVKKFEMKNLQKLYILTKACIWNKDFQVVKLYWLAIMYPSLLLGNEIIKM